MKIAIVGGGASGLSTAYLLRDRHQIDLFEKRAILGGNIRTLNKNVDVGSRLPRGVHIENGVVGFHEQSYPKFHRLMADLGVELRSNTPTGDMFDPASAAGARPSPGPLAQRLRSRAAALRLGFDNYLLLARLLGLSARPRRGAQIGAVLSGLSARVRTRVLSGLMLYYTMPYRAMAGFPAEIAQPLMLAMRLHEPWSGVRGGVYTYVERMLERLGGATIRTGVGITHIERRRDGVLLSFDDGSTRAYDKVVLATTPEQVLSLLADPSDAEKRRFSAWKKNTNVTIAHTDVSLYARYGDRARPGMADRFVKEGGLDAGYNTHMNDWYEIPGPVGYAFAFNLEDHVDPSCVLDRQTHDTPSYTVEAIRYRHEVIETNGENHTYHVGAYLGNALHEGAIASAEAAARRLGGRAL